MIKQGIDLSAKLAFDSKGLGELKQSARAGSPEALKTAATQFEAMFINMMMKSMRDATPQDGVLDNQQTKMLTSMLDQQMSQNLARRGVGLADVLIRQLSAQNAGAQALAIGAGPQAAADAMAEAGQMPSLAGTVAMSAARLAPPPGALLAPTGTMGATASSASAMPSGTTPAGRMQAPHVRAFQEKLGAEADAASRATGIPARFMLGQAALETGWGKREIRHADGSASHNLFGIKAGASWSGRVVSAVTTEYVGGVPQTRTEKFRAYDSYADSFKDYAKLISTNPRYEKVLAGAGDAASFAHGLQKAGYASDPHYATKLGRIISHSLLG